MSSGTSLPNSVSARDRSFVIHPYTHLRKHQATGPLVITDGDGVRVRDEDGKSYIEGMAGLWCASLGFREERLVAAAANQMRKLGFYHTFGGKSHEVVVDLAEKLIAMMPVPMSKVLFANSGSEANDAAVKLVWYYNNAIGRPEKKKIISRIKGYHGVTVASASLTGLPHLHNDFDLPIDRVLHTSCPHHYRYGLPDESEEEFATRCAEDLAALIEQEGPETVAAFIAEPIMGAGGVIVPPATYFDKVQEVLHRYDILLIADEVICGFGRTGPMFGTENYSLKPDILVVAKALSAAFLPISATIVSEPIYQAMLTESDRQGVLGHGLTYSGHPVSAAVALETLKIYEERDILSHVGRVGPYLQSVLSELRDHPIVGEVRGTGLIAGVELVSNKGSREPFPKEAGIGAFFVGRAQEHGAILRNLGDTIAFSPPLVIAEPEIDDLVTAFRTALDDTWRMVRDKQLVAA